MKKIFTLFMLSSCIGVLHAQGPYYQGAPSYQSQNGGQGQSPMGSSYGQSNGSNYPNYSNYSQQQNGQGQTTGAITDQSLTTQIQNTLRSFQYQGKYNDVTVSVSSGNVVLNGTTGNQDDKDALGRIVGGINGVRSVNNQVTVAAASQGYSGSNYQSRSSSSSNYQGNSYSNQSPNQGYVNSNQNYGNGNSNQNYGSSNQNPGYGGNNQGYGSSNGNNGNNSSYSNNNGYSGNNQGSSQGTSYNQSSTGNRSYNNSYGSY